MACQSIRHALFQGLARVTIGHVTNLSAMPLTVVEAIAGRLATAGISLTVLPATDLFLNGRGYGSLVPRRVAPAHVVAGRGVVTSIATNNVLNPFTPYGDASLMRLANLYANVAQLSRSEDLVNVFHMVSKSAARQLGAPHGLHVGQAATIVLIDMTNPAAGIREIARVSAGWKNGRPSFASGPVTINRPEADIEFNASHLT